MYVDELALPPGPALDGAHEILRVCNWILFTSGKRDFYAQAHAMARNHLTRAEKTGEWNWVGLVYATMPEFQQWAHEHPPALVKYGEGFVVKNLTAWNLTDGFFEVLQKLPDERRAKFAHPAGRAWDADAHFSNRRHRGHGHYLPMTHEEQHELHARIAALPGLDKFFTEEAGVPVLHAQFKQPASVQV
jgi:hypothetical protein